MRRDDFILAPLRYLSLFSGIEAATVAWAPLGWECVGTAEIETFPGAALAHHYPAVPNLGDVTKITEARIAALGPFDLMVFGSPCQDMSIAGKRKGLLNADGTVTRSGLFFTAINIFQWARKHCGARFALWENVPGAYSSNAGRDFASVVELMAGLDDLPVPAQGWGAEGCAVGDNGLLEWSCLDAQWFGVAQRRRRVFAILDTGDWASRQPILLERQSLRGDTAPRRETGQGVAGAITSSLGRRGGQPDCGSTAGLLQPVAFGGNNQVGPIDVATARNACGSGSGRLDFETETFLVQAVCSTLDASFGRLQGASGQDMNHGHSHLVPMAFDSRQDCVNSTEVFGSLGSSGPQAQAVTYSIQSGALRINPNSGPGSIGVQQHIANTLEARSEVQAVCITGEITHALKADGFDASEDGTGRGQPIVPSFAFAQNTRDEVRLVGGDGEISGALAAQAGMKQTTYVAPGGMAVRRLTPMECERLQGFPDGYTLIPLPKQNRHGAITRIPMAKDGPRYKALGNSMAVPVMAWIGRSIEAALTPARVAPSHRIASGA